MPLRALARKLFRSHSTLVEYERGHRLAPLEIVQAYESEFGLASGTLVDLYETAKQQLYGEDRSRRLLGDTGNEDGDWLRRQAS